MRVFRRFLTQSGGILPQGFHFFQPRSDAVPSRNALGRQFSLKGLEFEGNAQLSGESNGMLVMLLLSQNQKEASDSAESRLEQAPRSLFSSPSRQSIYKRYFM